MKSLRPLTSLRADEAQQVWNGNKGKDRENNSLSLPIDLFAPACHAPAARVYRACARARGPINHNDPGEPPCTRFASNAATGLPIALSRTPFQRSRGTGRAAPAKDDACVDRPESCRCALTAMATSSSRSLAGPRRSPETGAANSGRGGTRRQALRRRHHCRDHAAICVDHRYFQRPSFTICHGEQLPLETDFRRPVRIHQGCHLAHHDRPCCVGRSRSPKRRQLTTERPKRPTRSLCRPR